MRLDILSIVLEFGRVKPFLPLHLRIARRSILRAIDASALAVGVPDRLLAIWWADIGRRHEMRGTMTWEKLQKLIEEGAGQGHGESYRPFIEVRRRNSSPNSNQTVGPLPGQKRPFHGLARLERHIGMLCYWLGAQDVREQFPVWPFPHSHPLAGAATAEQYETVVAPGLLEIAEDAGIDHGVYVGTGIPYVATLDVVATVLREHVPPRLVVFSCKPYEAVANACPTSRILERLELERRYCRAISARYHIAHDLALPRQLFANLEVCGTGLACRDRICSAPRFDEFRDALIRGMLRRPLREAVRIATANTGFSKCLAWPAFRLLAWQLDIDIDLSEPIATSSLMVRGGRAIHARLRDSLFEGGGK
ncbi:TPA: TnsA endonuclease N-terminal domain-containing protein [Burkholderia vietnamiensis]|nr:hypothetical protein DF048_31915 [Burkholderia seminalis]HDR8967138.1 TnsA endonuclease N-terminal domain-containing protein [Burkholderia vietnamiensis]